MKKTLMGALICPVVFAIGLNESIAHNLASGDLLRPNDPVFGRQSSPSRYGPFRTRSDNAGGATAKAYSPFEELERLKAEHEQAKRAEYKRDTVLIKVVPQRTGGVSAQSQELLLSLLRVDGLGPLQRVFPNARRPAKLGPMALGARREEPDLTRWFRAGVKGSHTVEQMVADLQDNPAVEVAEPDYVYKLTGVIPDSGTDPNYADQWHLNTVNAPQAWQYLEDQGLPPGGSSDVTVAVIDTGVDYLHPDLAPNMWVNSREIPNNHVDDDGNGFVDDVHGVSVEGSEWDHTGDPMDDNGHGTHCAGIIAAVADNGIGGTGIAYNARIMAVRASGYSGNFYSSDVAEALYYAVEHGADVINMSFGGEVQSTLVMDALAVAFGQAVLVAAAGNEGWYNEIPPKLPPPKPFFPASYIYVLGVMAQDTAPNAKGENLARFSNWDNHDDTRVEYEVMAPGVDIFSTLPLAQYAAWDGTSMACPVVAGIAALLRTKFADKDVYSSRFIMGQIVSTGPILLGKVFEGMDALRFGYEHRHLRSSDALAALTDVPNPELSYLEHWLFDTAEQSAENDDDGKADSGETIDLAIVIRNHWGKADDVDVKLEPVARAGAQPDPFVTMITDTVNYGAVGSFNWDDNGMIYDDEGAITDVDHPFTFYVDPNTPNNHIISFLLTMTCRNGLDPADTALYTFTSKFTLVVQRGKVLPSIIEEDMTLTKENYWIIDKPVLVPEGVTMTVTEGTQIQFWSSDPQKPYSVGVEPFLQVEGNLAVQGTLEEPVELFPSELYPRRYVCVSEQANGRATFEYIRVMNPVLGRIGGYFEEEMILTSVDHAYFSQYPGNIHDSSEHGGYIHPITDACRLRNSAMDELGPVDKNYYYDPEHPRGEAYIPFRAETCLFDSCHLRVWRDAWESGADQFSENVFLRNYVRLSTPAGELIEPSFMKGLGTQIDLNNYISLTDHPIESYGGNSYFLLEAGRLDDLRAVQEFAAALGGNVVTIDNPDEDSFVHDYVATNQIRYAIIGLTDLYVEGVPEWIDGTPVTYTNVSQTYKNDTRSDYVVLREWDDKWQWNGGEGAPRHFLVEVPAVMAAPEIEQALDQFIADGYLGTFDDNAILNEWWNPNLRYWMRFFGVDNRDIQYYIPRNYWGTTSRTLIDAAIYDYEDVFNLGKIVYEPILEEPPESAYPFVADVVLSTDTEQGTTEVSAEDVTFTVTFNRDMDPNVQPQVSFGPDVPETDYTIHPVGGGWQDARTWVGTFHITPVTGDGYQLIRVAGAVAADDPWLVTGDDAGRFRFEIITSGAEAMNLQATGGERRVDLSWMQDDFELLAGFNLYRSTELEGEYQRINPVIIPAGQTHYRDDDVLPAVTYYYKFTVVKTDMFESDFSNIASAMPLDTIPPVISHTPIITAAPNLSLSIAADVTDNYHVSRVTLHYRGIADPAYESMTMTHTTGDRYSATLTGSLVTAPGLEYYIEASDGISIVYDGLETLPHVITVDDRPVVTSVTPNSGPSSGGTDVTIAGSNFKQGLSVLFDGTPASNVVRVSETQITCTTPAHFPAPADVCVVNPEPADSQSTLLSAFLYVSDDVVVSLPALTGDSGTTVDMPLSVSNVTGLRAVDATISFDSSVLSVREVKTGALTFGWTVETNTDTPGTVDISMAHSSAVTGSGVLAVISFDVVGDPGAQADITIDQVSLNEGSIAYGSVAGSFVVRELLTVSGSISYYTGGPASTVPRTLLVLKEEGVKSYSDTSDEAGQYSIANVTTGSYTLTPSKNNDIAQITAHDASLVLQAAAGKLPLSVNATLAADATCNGEVTSMDASYILEKSVGLREVPFPGAGKAWHFVPDNRTYDPLETDRSGQNFTAILIGDVSGNWQPGGDGSTAQTAHPANEQSAKLVLPQISAKAGATTAVPLYVELTDAELYSMDVTVSYDPNVIALASVSPGDAAEKMLFAVNTQPATGEGRIQIGLAGAEPLTQNGTLVELSLEIDEMSDEASAISLLRAQINEGTIETHTEDGSVTANLSLADFNEDGVIDMADFAMLAAMWLSQAAEPDWDSAYDIAAPSDGSVDLRDYAALAEQWQKANK
jgi:hypothetical protein